MIREAIALATKLGDAGTADLFTQVSCEDPIDPT